MHAWGSDVAVRGGITKSSDRPRAAAKTKRQRQDLNLCSLRYVISGIASFESRSLDRSDTLSN